MQETNEMRDRLINEFAENYMEKLFYFCLKKTGSHIEAEDLTQEAFLRFLASRTYRDENRQLQYLYTIARNLCNQHYDEYGIRELPADPCGGQIISELSGCTGHLYNNRRSGDADREGCV